MTDGFEETWLDFESREKTDRDEGVVLIDGEDDFWQGC